MQFTRREFLSYGACSALFGMIGLPLLAKKKALHLIKKPAPLLHRKSSLLVRPKKLWLYNIHTGEYVNEVYWDRGKIVKSGLKRISRLLRDHRANVVKTIDIKILHTLHSMQKMVGYSQQPVHIISGYRSEKTNAMLRKRSGEVAKSSYHTKGMALDILFRGVKLGHMRKAAIALGCGGVGYYPQSRFLHIDSRGHLVQWAGK